jgi:hypothetical protein
MRIHHDNIADFNDDRQLSGAVQNIFVGEVISKVGDKKLGSIPETQFEVQVIQNIKGDLNGSIKVNQEGGYMEKDLILVENDNLIEVGKKYLFATRYLPAEDWHTAVPKYGKLEIKSKEDHRKLIERFTKAYINEVNLFEN